MDPRNLFTLRYRRGSTGVVIAFISASSMEIAEAVGKHYCDSNNCRFIRVEPAIVADESILPNLEEVKAEAKARADRVRALADKEAEADRRRNAPVSTPPKPDARGRAAAASAGA